MLNEEHAKEIKKKLLEQLEKFPADQAADLKKQVEDASNEELEEFIKSQQKGGECIFCQIVKGTVETVKIYEDNDILAVLDAYPASKGHVLVMPREHISFINEMPDSLSNKIFTFVKTIEPVLKEITGADAVSIYIAQGELAGQRAPHLCINLIPRYKDDKISFEWERQKAEKEQLEEIAKTLREKASKEVKTKLETEVKKEIEKKEKHEASEAEKISKHLKQRIP